MVKRKEVDYFGLTFCNDSHSNNQDTNRKLTPKTHFYSFPQPYGFPYGEHSVVERVALCVLTVCVCVSFLSCPQSQQYR